MNLAASLRRWHSTPLGAYLPFPETNGYIDSESLKDCDDGPSIPDLGPLEECGWRITCATNFGLQLFAVPLSLAADLIPSRIDVVIPDQTEWAPELWASLGASRSAHMMDGRFNQLGIAKHVLKVLGRWSKSIPNFEKLYLELPFASTIVIKDIISDLDRTRVEFAPNNNLGDVLLSAHELGNMWDLTALEMPTTIRLQDLRCVSRLAPEITLVQIVEPKCDEYFIFKSRDTAPYTLYHELKQLLQLPPHENVIARPLFLVTIKPLGFEVDKVCGFILKYYDGLTLERALIQKSEEGSLQLADQLRWTKDLTEALIHVQDSPVKFWSDLKMDNILLPKINGREAPLLIDCEQSRNQFSWAPCEINHLEWLATVVKSPKLDLEIREKYVMLLQQYFRERNVNFLDLRQVHVYDNPPLGWCLPWTTSTAAEQEAGMACLLGKAIWCIFEGVTNLNPPLAISKPGKEFPEFPTFIRSPKAIQDLVRECTEGSREWLDGPLGLCRIGSKLYPRGGEGIDGKPKATVEETKEAIRRVWAGEVEKAEAFVRARLRYVDGTATAEDMQKLLYLKRPKLQVILERLEKIEV